MKWLSSLAASCFSVSVTHFVVESTVVQILKVDTDHFRQKNNNNSGRRSLIFQLSDKHLSIPSVSNFSSLKQGAFN